MIKMRSLLLIVCLVIIQTSVTAQHTSLLRVSDDNHYIVKQEGEAFLWLGDTAWEMIHRLNREEIDHYLEDRSEKGFNVIQTVILAEMDGLNTPNAYGHRPLLDNNPVMLNEEYFKLVDYVVEKAAKLDMYIGLLPSWGDKFNKRWGVGPEIFTIENARKYGELIAGRYVTADNIIWILGGDRIPESDNHYAIVRAMAQGIRKVDSLHLVTYHPSGAQLAADYFNESWLDIDMFQSGHSSKAKEYSYVIESRNINPARPVVNGEARYENIPDRCWEDDSNPRLDAADARVSAYWSIIAGAAGYTYGCNDIWQMYDEKHVPAINADTHWKEALDFPGALQMGYMKKIFEKLPWQEMKYDPSLVLNPNPETESFSVAAIGENKNFMLIYTPEGDDLRVDPGKLETDTVVGAWYDPRTGLLETTGVYNNRGTVVFCPPASGRGNDYLLILADEDIYDRLF